MKKLLIIIGAIGIVIALVIVLFFFLYDKKTAFPRENTFYLGMQGDTPVLFYRYTGIEGVFFYQFPDKQKEQKSL